MDQGQEFGAEFCATTVVFFRLFVIWKLLGKTWQQSAMEHGSRSRLRKRGYETPRAEAEVNEFVDFTLARAEPPSWTSLFQTQTKFGRRTRLSHSLL